MDAAYKKYTIAQSVKLNFIEKCSNMKVKHPKGSHGRHTDNSANVMAWFKSQYNNLLHDDFSR